MFTARSAEESAIATDDKIPVLLHPQRKKPEVLVKFSVGRSNVVAQPQILPFTVFNAVHKRQSHL